MYSRRKVAHVRLLPRVVAIVALVALAAFPATNANAGSTSERSALPDGVTVSALPSQVEVLTWNICGAWDGCKEPTKWVEKRASIVDYVRNHPNVGIVAIQEACAHLHSNPLASELTGLGLGTWSVSHRNGWDVGRNTWAVCSADKSNAQDAGVAVLMKQLPDAQPDAFTQTFASTGTALQGWACIKDRGNKLIACSVHIANNQIPNYEQIRRQSMLDISSELIEWQEIYGYRTVVAGDFNMDWDDDTLDWMHGFAADADEDNKANTTSGNKFDYIFYSRRAWVWPGGDVSTHGDSLSDHKKLAGNAQPRNQNEVNTAVAGTPPPNLPCAENTYVTVCWENYGDQIWVKDNEADGKRAVAEWSAGSRATNYWRNGICNNSLGAGNWGQCNKNMVENESIHLRGTRLNGGIFTDSTGVISSIV